MGPWLPVRSDFGNFGAWDDRPRSCLYSTRIFRTWTWRRLKLLIPGWISSKVCIGFAMICPRRECIPSRNQNMAMEILYFLDGFPIETSIFRGFPIVTFEYQRVNIIIYPCSWHSFGNVMINHWVLRSHALWTVLIIKGTTIGNPL
jgi:hypothetical protein